MPTSSPLSSPRSPAGYESGYNSFRYDDRREPTLTATDHEERHDDRNNTTPLFAQQNAGDEMLTLQEVAALPSGCLRAPCATGATARVRAAQPGCRRPRTGAPDLILWPAASRPTVHRTTAETARRQISRDDGAIPEGASPWREHRQASRTARWRAVSRRESGRSISATLRPQDRRPAQCSTRSPGRRHRNLRGSTAPAGSRLAWRSSGEWSARQSGTRAPYRVDVAGGQIRPLCRKPMKQVRRLGRRDLDQADERHRPRPRQ